MKQTRAAAPVRRHEVRRRARGGGRPAEEGDEDVLHVGVLVDEHRQELALPERPEQRHRRPGLPAPDVPHPAVGPEAVDEPGEARVDVLLADRVQREPVPRHAPGLELPVAEVGGDEDPALPAGGAPGPSPRRASPEQSTSRVELRDVEPRGARPSPAPRCRGAGSSAGRGRAAPPRTARERRPRGCPAPCAARPGPGGTPRVPRARPSAWAHASGRRPTRASAARRSR